MSTRPPILIFGYGNPSRGDDALGPQLVDRLDRLGAPELAGQIECLTDFQLQVEHALDLDGRQLVLFVDADLEAPPPWRLIPLTAADGVSFSTHAIRPEAVLRVFEEIHRRTPPPCFLLGIRGEAFELGAPLSRRAADHLQQALTLVLGLCHQPSAAVWRQHCTRHT